MFPWGNLAIVDLRRALFLHFIGLDFEENVMFEVYNVDLEPFALSPHLRGATHHRDHQG